MKEFLQRIEKLSPQRLALLALDQQMRLEKLERGLREPVAIVGIGCRFPGDVAGPDSLWKLLMEKRDAITEVPFERWDANRLFDPDPAKKGKISSRWGGFLRDMDRFDAAFFGLSRREAISMDPQQRMLLETAWEALEHAGVAPRSLSGSQLGIFFGLATADYHQLLLQCGRDFIDGYTSTGSAHSIAAGRLAYLLGVHGPSLALDTACSSSLVAIHLACQSLRLGECDMAVAGGANAILSPETTIALSRARMLSPDGRCKAFDSAADGFVRSEGCGVIVLKLLSSAQNDRDHIVAVIRGSAINQDGRSSGLTAPNGLAQENVIRRAMQAAGVTSSEIQYVEAHGTGTSLGDPIEAHALAATAGAGRGPENPLYVGSLKTNIGHLEAAAGIAGVIKTALSLQRGTIPASLHFSRLNPHIDLNGAPLLFPTAAVPWPGQGLGVGSVQFVRIQRRQRAHHPGSAALAQSSRRTGVRPPCLGALGAHAGCAACLGTPLPNVSRGESRRSTTRFLLYRGHGPLPFRTDPHGRGRQHDGTPSTIGRGRKPGVGMRRTSRKNLWQQDPDTDLSIRTSAILGGCPTSRAGFGNPPRAGVGKWRYRILPARMESQSRQFGVGGFAA